MPTTQSKDPHEQVNHPRWYNNHPSGVETIEVIEHLPANLSHAFKYIWRCGLKTANDPVRELRSALWYVRREIDRRERFNLGSELLKSLWQQLAEKVVDDAKKRGVYDDDQLALCLGDLLRDDLEGIVGRLERAILDVW